MFGRKPADGSSETALKDDSLEVQVDPAQSKKDRPTPSRKDAEAARKAALAGKPKPGASKKESRVAAREADRQARQKAREGMARGDERYLPARDKGPVRKFVRDFVDSRRSLAEFFVPVAFFVLIASMVPSTSLKAFVVLAWMLIIAIVAVDVSVVLFTMNKQLRAKYPDKADRKGVNFYAIMRLLQIRRLRIPPPQFKAGGKPVTPKQPK